MEDHHVDRPEVEAGQPAQPTGTNRSIAPERRPQRQGTCQIAEISDQSSERLQRRSSPRHNRYPQGPPGPGADMGPGSSPGSTLASRVAAQHRGSRGLGRPGGHSEGQNTRSHPELGRENPQRRWYCVSRRGRVGRRQALQTLPNPNPRDPDHTHTSRGGAARYPPDQVQGRSGAHIEDTNHRGVEQPGSSSGS